MKILGVFLTILGVLCGNTWAVKAQVAPLTPSCKFFHVTNNGGYILQPEYYECGTKEHKKETLSEGKSGTYQVEAGTQVWAERKLGLTGTASVHVWPNNDLKRQDVGEGWNLTCMGLASDPSCHGIPMKPTDCKTFYVKNNLLSGSIIQPEYYECRTQQYTKAILDSGDSATYFVEPEKKSA